jgi:SAM-dependent methyltransferase
MESYLKSLYEQEYRSQDDPWNYWTSEYEIRKYHQQIGLSRQFCNPKSILEIGCSTGAHTALINQAFPEARITGVDISSAAISRARQNVTGHNVYFICDDIFLFAEKLRENSFDLMFWSEAFDDLHDHVSIARFSELARRLSLALCPYGILCISHIHPRPLSFDPMDAGRKNVEVFHTLLRDYLSETLVTRGFAPKSETNKTYFYDLRIYRPKHLQAATSGAVVSVDRPDVIIPARDEAQTIAHVIATLRKSPDIGRIIVVDNGSVDNTRGVAQEAGATVVDCPERGYGRAVKQGVRAATSRWVFKLDADIENPNVQWPRIFTTAAQEKQVSLVKGCWIPSLEDPDRVTNFTAKPAFRIFFPELAKLRSPLSGVFLFDREAINVEELPNNFSFDVAMMIKALTSGQRFCEAEIETVRHATIANSKRTYEHYFRMSDELMRYIVEAGLEFIQ